MKALTKKSDNKEFIIFRTVFSDEDEDSMARDVPPLSESEHTLNTVSTKPFLTPLAKSSGNLLHKIHPDLEHHKIHTDLDLENEKK